MRIGETIALAVPCVHCGGRSAVVHDGKGPHAAELRCADCGLHHRWIAKRDLDEAPDWGAGDDFDLIDPF